MRDPQAVWQPSPNYSSGRNGYSARWVILHGTAGGGSVEWLTNPASGVSAHYVITRDGVIHQLVDENDWAYGNGVLSAGHDPWWSVDVNPNWVTISIEHEKLDSQNASDLTPAQKAASFGLVARICQRWKIPARQADATGGITGHFSIDPVNRSQCPGVYPWAELWAYLKGNSTTTQGGEGIPMDINDPRIQSYFNKVSNTRLHCKSNNIDVADGILGFYLRYGGVALFGLPTSGELYNLVPGLVCQKFERAILAYDPNHTYDHPPIDGACYLLHLDGGLGQGLIAQPLVAPLQASNADLSAKNTALTKAVSDLKATLDKVEADNAALKAAGSDPSLVADMGQIYTLAAKHHV